MLELNRKPLRSYLLAGLLGVVTATVVLPAAPAWAQVRTLPDFTDLVDQVGPSVVNIRTIEKVKASGAGSVDEQMLEFFRRFGIPVPPNMPRAPRPDRGQPQPDEEQPRGVGSGFILTADGFVMTNAHVVEGADEVIVTLTDKREFKARIIGADKRSDVAVVKIEASGLPAVKIGDINRLKVGEWVMAIGSPFGLENTVTAGIVSAKQRDTGDYLPFIQTDVAINPGNSGGPLINMRGEVVGINSQIYSRSGGFQGISFAIPIDEAMRVVEQLRASGSVTRGRIGVVIGELSKEVAESIGLGKAQGAVVRKVEAGGPADKAGIQDGDVILKFNGISVEKSSDLPRIVGATKPSSKASISVWRKGGARELSVIVGELESDKVAQKSDKKSKKEQASNALGVYVSDLTDAQKKETPGGGGVVIDNVEGPAAQVGLRVGDIILSMNNVDVKDAKQFIAMLSKIDAKKPVVVLVRRGDASQFVLIRPLS